MDTCIYPAPSISISPQQLAARIGQADTPLLLDVRREARFVESSTVVAGARRCAPDDVAGFAAVQFAREPFREIVAYCVYGHNVSGDAVALLQAAGLSARKLAGGFEGGENGVDSAQDIASWRSVTLPTMLKRLDFGVPGQQPSRWITRAQPKIDRIACPWLIRRFIDSEALIFYVPASQVLAEAERLAAVAFDLPGAPVTHQGDLCSFDALLAAFGLQGPALQHLARIVRGADTNRPDLVSESAGLLALSLGLSQLHAADDRALLEAALPLYDALYAWCQRQASAFANGTAVETHDWKPEAASGVSA